MSLTLVIWLFLFVVLALLAFVRPAYGVGLYMLTFFLCPPFWWWGNPIEGYRWNLYSGVILLAAVVLSRAAGPSNAERVMSPLARRLCWIAFFILLNATVVHAALADSWEISSDKYILLAKFILLFFMIHLTVRTEVDLRIVLLAILLGAGYIGYEVTINDRGRIESNRLEGIGAPAASQANQFASLMVTLLPVTAVFFLAGRWWEKLAMLPIAPFIVNVILLCNSRGAFLAAITSAVAILILAPRPVRMKALKVVALGAFATWMLLGDARIVERFLTTFADDEERDASANTRIENAKAGLEMIKDYPLGAGGDGFKNAHGRKYQSALGYGDNAGSIHNGFLNEACEWGVQGLLLRMAFVLGTIVLLWRNARLPCAAGQEFGHLLGAALLAGLTAFLVTCLFGDFLDSEWGYWITALGVAHSRFVFSRRPAAVEPQWQSALTPAAPRNGLRQIERATV